MKQKEAFIPLDQLGWQWHTVNYRWNPGLCTRKGWKSSFLSKRGDKLNGEGECQCCLITAGITLLWERGLHAVNSKRFAAPGLRATSENEKKVEAVRISIWRNMLKYETIFLTGTTSGCRVTSKKYPNLSSCCFSLPSGPFYLSSQNESQRGSSMTTLNFLTYSFSSKQKLPFTPFVNYPLIILNLSTDQNWQRVERSIVFLLLLGK